ncbi:armadillo-type protein [Scheffersomyces xylosifermentans]|uniref:armadillo-type protein n=1 Tax=Scheffersomyces xylosifermentans TaxID=1304137 RepID=UPI00315D3125
MDFNLSTYFNAFDVDKDYSVDISDIDAKLESVTNAIANNPDSINYNTDFFEDLIELTHGYRTLDGKHQKQLGYLLTSSFNAVGHSYKTTIDSGDFVDSLDNFKSSLEKYGYLIFVLAKHLGKEDHSKIAGKSKSTAGVQAVAKWKSNCFSVEDCLTSIVSVLDTDLSKVFVTTPERDLFVELFTRPIINLMESPERMKVVSIKLLIFKAISISVKFHGHANIIQHSIIQCLTYYVHLPNYMAELLHILAEEYDYMVLTEEVLREISQTQFNSNDTNGPKAVSEFLIKLSELSPRLILKQMSSTAQLLDNSNQTLRCSVVEACGNIVVDIIKNSGEEEGEDGHNGSQQVDGLLDLLQERFLDQNPYVRTKAFQAMTKVTGLKVKLTERRQLMMMLAVRSLDDRSTLVRRNVMKLMSKLVLTHQFTAAHGSQLGYSFWKARLDEAEAELQKYLPLSPQKKATNSQVEQKESNPDDMEVDEEDRDMDINVEDEDDMNDDSSVNHDELNASMIEQEQNLPDRNVLLRAKLKVNYYRDAVDFIEAIQKGTEVVSRLLFSKNRNEAIDSMNFLVLADAYGIENSGEGIRRMLHLVWSKGSSDEGKSVPSHLIDCYKDLFLTAPATASKVEKAAYIAKNLIGLTHNASVADLASLEKLLGMMYAEKLIGPEVIKILWQLYSFETEDEESPESVIDSRRGSIIILGMFALEDSSIVVKGLDALLTIGLGAKGKQDLILAKYTCVALQRIVPPSAKKKTTAVKIAREDEFIEKLKEVILDYNEESEWYSVAEQAIGAIFQTATQPEEVCSEILKKKSVAVFKGDNSEQSQVISLSQLLFIVGHVAIKTIVHLEKLEAQFKKKKHEAESKKSNNEDEEEEGDELEMIGGTSEDDFTDAVVHVKERELLYGENSLLARFGPLVKEICANNKNYDNRSLQRSAVLCMAKLMCVSSIYCEENLPLLITIMEKSDDPITRCNCVLALGDMAVCFNNIVDESTDFVYRRLTDESMMVQRTCLMTVTFLILAGQVKVKGQLSSMAKCLENPDQGISDMCRLFFAELATKDNAIYNGFIDIFSGLSNDETLSKDAMKRIIKFLLSFIDKERHQKQLTEKLLARLAKCQSESQWDDVAFVLGAIPYKNDTVTSALEEGYKMVSARQ